MEEKKFHWIYAGKNFSTAIHTSFLNVSDISKRWVFGHKNGSSDYPLCEFSEKEYKEMVSKELIPDHFEAWRH